MPGSARLASSNRIKGRRGEERGETGAGNRGALTSPSTRQVSTLSPLPLRSIILTLSLLTSAWHQ